MAWIVLQCLVLIAATDIHDRIAFLWGKLRKQTIRDHIHRPPEQSLQLICRHDPFRHAALLYCTSPCARHNRR